MKANYNDIDFILENVHDHIVITDKEGIIQYVNSSFLRSSGYTFEEIQGKNMNILKSGFHSKEFYRKFWSIISSGEKFTGIFKNKRKNGDFFWVKKSVSPIFKEEKHTGYLSISSDITGYKAFENKLKEEYEFSDSIINTSQALIIVLNTQGTLISVNNACAILSGFQKDELIGKSFNYLLSSGHNVNIDQVLNSLNNQIETTNSFVAPLNTKSDNTHLIRWSNSVIKNEDGSTKYILCNGIDITEEYNYRVELSRLNESLQAEVYRRTKDLENKNKELIQAKQFLKKIVESVPALIFLIDFEIIEITCINPDTPYFPIPELTKNFLTIPDLENLIHPDDLQDFIIHLKNPDLQKELNGVEFRVKNKNGDYVWLYRKSIPYEIEENTSKKSRISFFFDINDRKMAEIKATESEKRLEEAQRIANIGNWDWNINTNDLFWSDETYRIFEVEVQSFIPFYSNFLERVHPNDTLLITDAVAKALEQNAIYDIEHRIITPSDSIKYVRERGAVYYGCDGQPLRMIGTIQDITKQKETEFKLKQNELRLEEAQRISQLGNWSWDVCSNEIFWSDEVYRIFEVDKISFKVTYSSYFSKIHPNDVKFVEDSIHNLLKNKTNYDIVHRILLQNGKIKYIRCKSEFELAPDGSISNIVGTIQNITDQKLLQNKMEQSHEIIENSLNAVFNADLNGNIHYANKAAAKLWGFKNSDEMIRQWPNIANYWHYDSKHKALEIIEELPIKESIILFAEIKAIKPDGSIFYPIFNANVLKDENNKVIGFIASFFDMTEKIKIEKELAKYDERLQFIFTNTEEIIYAFDTSGDNVSNQDIIFISDSVEKVLGYSKDMFINNIRLLENLIHPDDIPDCKNKLYEFFLNPKATTFIFRIKNKSDHYIWMENKLTPNINGKNKIISCYGHAREVTERIKHERALIKSEKKYRELYENATVGIFKTNIKTKKAVEANDVCVKLFGYNSKEDFLSNFSATDHYYSQADREIVLKEMPAKGFMEGVEIKFKKVNEEMFWGQISAKYLPETHEIEGVVIDITKRVLFEEELKKTITEKELLLREVHHRVKNNLQIVSGLLLLKINKISDPKILAPLNESRDRIETISLVHEKLYQTESISHISFKSYLEELSTILQQTYSDKKVEIISILPQLLLNIDAAIPMGLIFHELISNSIKHGFVAHTANVNQVKIEIGMVEENRILIQYSDNGSGFDSKSSIKSNSLGMKLVDGLVKQLGGSLIFQSEPGKGVSVSFKVNIRI